MMYGLKPVDTTRMKIKRLVIENFKSIERIELIEPNPFTVFVGPNGSGKSNIFEALEFHIPITDLGEKFRLFGGVEFLQNRRLEQKTDYHFYIESDLFVWAITSSYLPRTTKNGISLFLEIGPITDIGFDSKSNEKRYKRFARNFSRIFVSNDNLLRQKFIDNSFLNTSVNNLEKVLGRLLEEENLKEEIFEWLTLFIPEFAQVEVRSDALTATDTLLVYEKSLERPFTKNLISDGTYNILALLTAVYQSNEPQFLCIEEPENGLNPKVVKELVNLCRYACEEFGHFIWLNTHSQTLVSQLTPEEIVLVDKKEGATRIKQIKGMDLHGLPMDEAWLSNALGGGLPW